jgi:hypothetical protein
MAGAAMVNRARGEALLSLYGRDYRLCLTLGALAEIEAGLDLPDLSALDARLSKPTARDLCVILCALLRGGGEPMGLEDVGRLPLDARAVMTAVSEAFAAAGLRVEALE